VYAVLRRFLAPSLLGVVVVGVPAQTRVTPRVQPHVVAAREAAQVRRVCQLAFVVPDAEPAAPALPARAPAPSREHTLLVRARTAQEAGDDAVARELLDCMFAAKTRGAAIDRFHLAVRFLLSTEHPALQELLLDTVQLCGSAAQLGAEPGETVVVIDRFGKRIGGTTAALHDEHRLAAELAALVHPAWRLTARGQVLDTACVPATLAALAAGSEEQDVARTELRPRWNELAPLLILARRTHPNRSVRIALEELVDDAFAAARVDGAFPPPFGMRWADGDQRQRPRRRLEVAVDAPEAAPRATVSDRR
jgi:hypothetical protein